MSRVTLTSAEVKFRRQGHVSRVTGHAEQYSTKIGSVRNQHLYVISLVSAKPGKILPSRIFFLAQWRLLCTSSTNSVIQHTYHDILFSNLQ